MRSQVDCLLTTAGLPLFLVDICLDVLAAVEFYREGSYPSLGVLLVLLIGSSVLVQLYSWLWYSYDHFDMKTRVEESAKPGLAVLHWVQLGIYVRCVQSSSRASGSAGAFRKTFHFTGNGSSSPAL